MAEAETRLVGLPTQRRFRIEQLLRKPDQLFADTVFGSLPAIARADFAEACRSLAFENPTAAAFLLLRAVEECVRLLHRAYYPREKATDRAWGPVLRRLADKPRAPKPDEILIKHLDHLRDRFRNPTDHPDKRYHIEEAEDLFYLCIEAISRCVRDPRVVATMATPPK